MGFRNIVANYRLKTETSEIKGFNSLQFKFSGPVNIDFSPGFALDSHVEFILTGDNISFSNLENINKERMIIYIDDLAISKLHEYADLIKKCDSVHTEELNVDSFEFIEGGWNITGTEGESYTVMGVDAPYIDAYINVNSITRSTDKINKINFIINDVLDRTVTIDSWDTADYNPFSSFKAKSYIFGSSMVPILSFKGQVTLNCSDTSVTELRVKDEAEFDDLTLKLAENSHITKMVFEKEVNCINDYNNPQYKTFSVEFLSGFHARGSLSIENEVPPNFTIKIFGEVSFRKIKNGRYTFEYLEGLVRLKDLPKIIADKNTIDPKIYEIDLVDNTDASWEEFLKASYEVKFIDNEMKKKMWLWIYGEDD